MAKLLYQREHQNLDLIAFCCFSVNKFSSCDLLKDIEQSHKRRKNSHRNEQILGLKGCDRVNEVQKKKKTV